MPEPSDPSLRVLLALRLASFGSTATVAARAGLDEDRAADLLEVFAGKGWVRHRRGGEAGWLLTAAGRAEGERLAAEELDATASRAVVADAYARFLARNPAALQLCTDWQLVERDGQRVPNPHDDPDHDAAVVDALAALVVEVRPVVDELAAALERFGGYGPRLDAAVARVRAGDGDWFAKPTVDSFHTVWFELHEDLLATLGIERGTEEDR